MLIVEDDLTTRMVLERVLTRGGYEVTLHARGEDALVAYRDKRSDVVITDITMPGMGGVELLRRIRALDADVPLLLMTANPSVHSAISAIDFGALAYLVKPLDFDLLLSTIARASSLSQLARIRSELALAGARATRDGSADEQDLTSAIEQVWLAWQPIVRWSSKEVYGYEALVRSREPKLPHPGALLDAAERQQRLPELGAAIRAQVVAPPDGALAFVNLHPLDLLDDTLNDPTTSFSALAPRIVLEITERAALERVADAEGRLRRLRDLGFRIAIDDLGAGYSGLSAFALLNPELAKLDMSLVRGVARDPVRQRLIRAMVPLCADLGIHLVAEGIETPAERDALVDLGCDLLQGYLFARPGPAWPAVRW